MIGRTISHYRILEKLGQGGMGVVYKAHDSHLDRIVAIKVLPPERVSDPERKRRFVQEARAASALNHPNIVTIHDIDSADGVDFIVMELVEGEPLSRLIASRRIGYEEALHYGAGIANALTAAHAAGIVHRDLKPGNIMVAGTATGERHVKVLDFGLAKLTERHVPGEESETETAQAETGEGVVLGTVSYMSPEQAEGKRVDARSDIFSFGSVLYEMLTGQQPFHGESHLSTLMALLRETPKPVRVVRKDVPAEVERILRRCLEKDREHRYQTSAELLHDLQACKARLATVSLIAVLRRPRYAIPAAALLVVLFGGGSWWWLKNSRERWVQDAALPEIQQRMDKEDWYGAFELTKEARKYLPNHPKLKDVWADLAVEVAVVTDPPGADVAYRNYFAAKGEGKWESLGRSPVQKTPVPGGMLQWQITKDGYESFETLCGNGGRLGGSIKLHARGTAPEGTVFVPGGDFQSGCLPAVKLEDYWLDKYEVTNRQFKEFMAAGGYQKREYWKHAFVRNGKALSWEAAMAEFRDATGRPGPSTWELGSYKEGQADYPVGGVSWYEAAAYAEFAGKSLPTVYHWRKAVGIPRTAEYYVTQGNFGPTGPVKVAGSGGPGLFGTYGLPGNVKEWCLNEFAGERYILGGSWGEPIYMFGAPNKMPPFDRSATHGFRCARYVASVAASLAATVDMDCRVYSKEKPVNDDVFKAYRSLYAYDKGPLEARVEKIDDSPEFWRREKVSFNAAYGSERVSVYLLIPKNSSPPYQAVVHFPGSGAAMISSSENLYLYSDPLDIVIRSGRILVFPVIKGTFERRVTGGPSGPNTARERIIQQSKDLGRTIDYLETRDDIDSKKVAFYGLSWGGWTGPICAAVEPRFRTVILLSGGLRMLRTPPEMDPLHFAPRVTVPVLMLNGRNDHIFPLEASQKPLFQLLGTPAKDKRHIVYESGHVPPRQAVTKDLLDWLDKYLGPVQTK